MIELSNVSILNILPPNLADDKSVKLAAAAFDETLRGIIAKIPNVSILPRIAELTDSLLLDLLAWQFHVDFYEASMPIEKKRVLVHRSLDWHLRKGTPSAVEEVVTAVLSDAIVTEWFEYGGEEGFFRVETQTPVASDKEYEDMVAAINSVKNTRSWLEFILVIVHSPLELSVGIGVWIEDVMVIGLPPNEVIIEDFTPVSVCAGVFAYIGAELEILAGGM